MRTKDIFQYALAAVVIIGWFVLFGLIFTHTIPEGNATIANQLFGSLTMAVGLIIAYFFGTNKESAAKTEMIYKSAPIDTTSTISDQPK